MRLLVFGSNGQLGGEVTRRAARAGHACIGLTRAQVDVTDRVTVIEAVKSTAPILVVNAAAYTAVDKAESEPEAAFAVNRHGAAYIAEACERAGVPLIHVSTDYVYDGTKIGPYVEDDPVAPLGAYGASKLAGEEAVRRICGRHLILRTSWVYGVDGRNFVTTMLQLGAEQARLRVVDDQRGSPTFAGDLAAAVLALAERVGADEAKRVAYGVFHCAGSGATTWCGFAREIFTLAGPALAHVPQVEAIATADYPTRARRPANSELDCARLKAVYGLALRPWEQALADMLDAAFAPDRERRGEARAIGGRP